MIDNLRHWSRLKKTDPAHTKPFQRAGGFRGTSIKPIYMVQQMTELFGPVGIGWGFTKPDFTVQAVGDRVLVYCTVSLWYMDGDVKSEPIYGTGGDYVASVNAKGQFADDEAFKKAQTDAQSNALKLLGVGADVHMGQHDDDKYVRELRNEMRDGAPDVAAPTPPKADGPPQSPTATKPAAPPPGSKLPVYDADGAQTLLCDRSSEWMNAVEHLIKTDENKSVVWAKNATVFWHISKSVKAMPVDKQAIAQKRVNEFRAFIKAAFGEGALDENTMLSAA